jgi:geranylgeranyl diphosphate synthase type I
MSLQDAMRRFLPAIEEELRQTAAVPHPALGAFYGMMRYHLGWTDTAFQPAETPAGKRLRPLFCLLACWSAGGDPELALPAAAALELLHNFSLIHDDIEDNSATRRHRATVWTVWGVPQAINVGDGMFALANLTLGRLACTGAPQRLILPAITAFQEACLTLTEGQFLDMDFETRAEVDLDDYLWMIQDKTASLLATSTRLGALLADAETATVGAYREFGAGIGMAFQIQDDVLGMWGDEALLGKSTASDIVQRKKTLPWVYAVRELRRAGRLSDLARLQAIYGGPAAGPAEVAEVLGILESVGARHFCDEQVLLYQEQAMDHLQRAACAPQTDVEALQVLRELADSLIGRQY